MLRMRDVSAGYGGAEVIRGISLEVPAGTVRCLLGRNGAGKTTLLKAIMGLVPPRAGEIFLGDDRLDRLPAHRVPAHGVGYVPQGRGLFRDLTVAENIQIGLMTRRRGRDTRDRVLDLFPVLSDRLGQIAGTLSGGEQQQLAMARALCIEPSLLLLDEPTEGLQPSMIALVRDTVRRLRGEGVAVLLVEQRVEAVLDLADTVSFMSNGRVETSLDAAEARNRPDLTRHFVGID